MSGVLNILILGCAVAVHVADNLPPPTGLEISALGLGRVNVSWRHSANPPGENVIYWVKVKTPDLEEEKFPSENFYLFDWLAVHRGLNVQVAVIIGAQLPNSNSLQWATKDLPPFPGDEGTAPLILTCDIHYDESEKCWLSCHWLPGATAPLDTQYYLYFRHEMRTEKCLSYVTEPGVGRRIGCRTLITDSLLYFNEFLVHINGTSHSRQIRAAEHVFNIKDAEVIPPVWNLAFNTEDRLLSWTKPIKSLPDICFNYQINVWSKVKNETITVSKVQQFSNEDLKEPTNKQHVRVRAVGKTPCWTKEKYSSWTEVIHIEEKNNDVLWIALALCLFVACLALFVVCVRFWRRMFPQIPKPKHDFTDALNSAQHQALIRCSSWDAEEVISYIEVIGFQGKQCKMPADYGQVTD